MIDSVIYLCELKVVHVVYLREIVYFKAQRSYCQIFLINGETITHSKPLATITKDLEHHLFLHIGQSHVINRNQIRQIDKGKKLIKLANGHEIHYPMKTCELLLLLGYCISEEKTACRENQ
jgi:DNA-binding LytR/AlgR family response regulator